MTDSELPQYSGLLPLLIDSVVEYAIFALDADGYVVTWNIGAERLKGYRSEEIIGQHFSRFYTDDDIQAGRPAHELEVATTEGRVEDEGWRVRKDGSQFWANVIITALRRPDGSLEGFGKVTRDLTARKRSEDVMRSLLEQERHAADRLRQLDRLKSEFVTMVAHDLSSPLTVVMGFVDTLLGRWDGIDDSQKRDILRRVSATTLSLLALVNDILQVERIESDDLHIERAPFDLSALVRRAAQEAVPPDSVDRVRVQAAEDVPLALGDERRVWQVLTNLLSNAVKFSPADQPIELELSAPGADLVVSVGDHGPGIAPEYHEAVFGRFARLPQPEGTGVRGTGLGLYISKRLVEGQGGRIWIESDLGSGATFRFTLPVAAGEEGS